MTHPGEAMSAEEAVALAASQGLGYFHYGDALSLRCQACDSSWEPEQPWRDSTFACLPRSIAGPLSGADKAAYRPSSATDEAKSTTARRGAKSVNDSHIQIPRRCWFSSVSKPPRPPRVPSPPPAGRRKLGRLKQSLDNAGAQFLADPQPHGPNGEHDEPTEEVGESEANHASRLAHTDVQ